MFPEEYNTSVAFAEVVDCGEPHRRRFFDKEQNKGILSCQLKSALKWKDVPDIAYMQYVDQTLRAGS